MLNKSLLHIVYEKLTFIDVMFNLMTICAMWRIWSWNSTHTLNPSILIPWNSFNYASILLIKYGFTIFHFYSHMNMFNHYYFYYW